MADYELWLTDDSGKRIKLLKDIAFLTYTRAVDGLGTVNVGLPFGSLSDLLLYFQPDWRLEVWRSPARGIPLRREDVFILRKPHIYTRKDNVQIIQYYGRNGIDLLNRRSVVQRAGTSYAKKTDTIDDLMKAYVRQAMLYGSALDPDGVVDNSRAWPQNEFSVEPDTGAGPSLTRDFADRNIFDLCKELNQTSEQYYRTLSTNKRIHFDVIPVDVSTLATVSGAPLGWQFRTYAGLRGQDRTAGIQFSLENENIREPSYADDHLDEITAVYVRGNGQGLSQIVTSVTDTTRLGSSRWNRVEKVISATSETTTAALQDAGRVELGNGIPNEKTIVTLLNNPGSLYTPRSLYGVDWDLGDLVQINYAKKQVNMEIRLVYVSLNEKGEEEITGRNEIQ